MNNETNSTKTKEIFNKIVETRGLEVKAICPFGRI